MKRIVCSALLLLAMTSCQSLLTPSSHELTLKTDAVKINCIDGASGAILGRDCFKVYTVPDHALYDTFSVSTVKGFTYQEGYESTILVRIDSVTNAPADASSVTYTLLRVVTQTKVQ